MEKKNYRWFSFVMALFITTLIISNIIAVKLVNIFGLFLPAAVILFPIAYIFGDVLTEVYGYAQARKVIWTGFFCNLVAVAAIWLAGLLPAAPFWNASFYDSPEALTEAYLDLLEVELKPLIPQGLAAAVYTQTSDVEIEINGYLII